MGFKCGIVGLPNVGKSTLFNALTKAKVEVENFPFCTIKPNTRVVPIPDKRLKKLAEIVKPQRVVPAKIKFVDIAGLVKGASKGDGLGNHFLSDIRETEAIVHVVRCFEDDNIIHVLGKVNPLEDINILNTELVLSDLEICERTLQRVKKNRKSDNKNTKLEKVVLEKCLSHLENANMLRSLPLNSEENEAIRYLSFLTLKPIMYIANIEEDGFKNNLHLDQVCAFAKKEGSVAIPVCASLESDIANLKDEEHSRFMMERGMEELGINKVIRLGYALLNLQTYFTVGMKEVRAWAIPIGSTALQAARKIHTDFEKGFIRAQTIAFNDFIACKGKQGAKETGNMRYEGKEYIIKDGDVINFLFNV